MTASNDIQTGPLKRYGGTISRLLRFGLATIVSASLTFVLPIFAHEMAGIAENTAVAIGFASAYVVNLILLKVFVYRSSGNWAKEVGRYIVVNGAFRLVEYASFYALSNIAGWDYRLSVLVVLALSAVAKFSAYRFVFRSA